MLVHEVRCAIPIKPGHISSETMTKKEVSDTWHNSEEKKRKLAAFGSEEDVLRTVVYSAVLFDIQTFDKPDFAISVHFRVPSRAEEKIFDVTEKKHFSL